MFLFSWSNAGITPNGILLLCIENFGNCWEKNCDVLKKLGRQKKDLNQKTFSCIAATTIETRVTCFPLFVTSKPNEPVTGTICLFCAFFWLVSLCSFLSSFSVFSACRSFSFRNNSIWYKLSRLMFSTSVCSVIVVPCRRI